MTRGENRRFSAILLCSALLHGVLFALISVQRQPSPPPTILASIRLIEAASGGEPATPARAVADTPARVRPEKPVPVLPAMPRPSRAITSAPVAVQASAVGAIGPAVADVAPAPVPAVAAGEVQRPVVVAASPSQSDMLASYRQRLTELFARGYEYPRIAALRGWEGEVRLRLKVARKGNLLGIQLDRSSGFDVLDQHAQAMLEGHGALPPFPDALEGSEIQVIVPINYKLRKTT